MDDRFTIVISRDGETTVITGWRAWLVLGVISLLAAIALVVLAFLFLGIAVTVGTLLVFGIPIAIAILIFSEWLRSRG